MAVTKIHGIKTTVDKAIEYICNPDKTDQKLYISSFACSPETAVLDFKYTLDHTHDCQDAHNANKAFHLIQAFSDRKSTRLNSSHPSSSRMPSSA